MSKKRKNKSRKPGRGNQHKPVLKSGRLPYLLCVLGIALVAVLIYHNSLEFPPVFDDENIFDNPDLKDMTNLPRVLSTWPTPRPVLAFSFALNYYWGGMEPFGYHVVNILLHIANGILLFFVLVFTVRSAKPGNDSSAEIFIALAAALIFISHPIQTESITYIWGRSAVLCSLFCLLALLLFIKANLLDAAFQKVKTPRLALTMALYITGAALSFILALGSKAIALSLPAILLLYDYLFLSKRDVRRFLRQVVTFHIYFLAIAAFRVFAHFRLPSLYTNLSSIFPSSTAPTVKPLSEVGTSLFGEFFAASSLTRYENVLTQSRAFVDYLRLLFFPANQNADWGYVISKSLLEPSVLFSMIILLALLVLAIILFKKSKLMSFGIFWYLVTMVLFVVQPLPDIIVERRLYIPGIGFCIFVAAFLYHGFIYLSSHFGPRKNYKNFIPVFLVILVALYSFKSIQRNTIWQDPFTLWQDAAQKSPQKVRPNNNFGILCLNRGLHSEAVAAFQQAIAADSSIGLSYANLLSAYCLVAFEEKTEASIYRAVDFFGEILAGKPDVAVDWYIKNYPQMNKSLFNGAIYQLEKQLQETDSRNGNAYIALGLLYYKLLGNPVKAMRYFEKGTSLGYSRFSAAYIDDIYLSIGSRF